MMVAKASIAVLCLFFVGAFISPAWAKIPAGRALLEDGAVITIEGKLVACPNDQSVQITSTRQCFKIDSDVEDRQSYLPTGTVIKLLPSVGLEKMIANEKLHTESAYRLYSAIVTKFRRENFLFVDYFLPVTEIESSQSQAEQLSQSNETKMAVNEPNDILDIPEELLSKLNTRRIISTKQLVEATELKQNHILADRNGFIVEESNGQYVFSFDALGLSIQQASIRLLPCEVLENAVIKQKNSLARLRFKVAGVVTEFNGKRYLLLRRAARVYGHGNFSG